MIMRKDDCEVNENDRGYEERIMDERATRFMGKEFGY